MNAQLCHEYLAARGISDYAIKRNGLELVCLNQKRAKDRLGRHLPHGTNEVIWFPLYDRQSNIVSWIARPLPTINPQEKFICPLGSNGVPFVPQVVYGLPHGQAVILTEGPVKALVCQQAGFNAIGLNGVWGASVKNSSDEVCIRADLQEALDWRGRNVYLAFDADLAINPDVRHALFRLFFVLSVSGAEVLQLTTWDLSRGKGIDDYLVGQLRSNGQCPPAKVLEKLLTEAKPFLEIVRSCPFDLALVSTELAKVKIPERLREQLCRRLAKRLEVSAQDLRTIGPTRKVEDKPGPSFAATYEPWPEAVDAEKLFTEIMFYTYAEAVIDEAQLFVSALEVMLSWVHDQMEFSPILYITGPTRECGKTKLLSVIGKMARRPLKTSSISPAALFRLCELFHPTFLVDEAQDAYKNEDFWTVLKAGHDPGDKAVRCDPNTLEPKTFDVFCPKVLAGIGRANGQIMSRSIVIEMERRKGKTDYSRKMTDPVFVEIRRKLARWANDVGDLCRFRLPGEAASLRGHDNWEVFYRVAGGVSETVAKQLLEFIPHFVDEEQDFDTYLLTSLRDLYREHKLLGKGDHLGSEMILSALNDDKEAPWFRHDSKGITRERLSARLRRYKLKPKRQWYPEIAQKVRGYFYIDPDTPQNSLKHVFEQYLPPEQNSNEP